MQKKQHRFKKKKHTRLPLHVYLSYLLVAALVFTGVTFSKYVTSTNAGDSARAATFGEVKMTENDKPEQFIIAPGVNIQKNPLVSFAMEKESESAAYVFVYVAAENWKFDGTTNTYKFMRDNKELMSWSVDAGWKYVATNGWYNAFYCYIPPNGKLDAVPFIKDGKITVSPELYASDLKALTDAHKTITFKAYAVQANGFGGAEQAWWDLANSINIS